MMLWGRVAGFLSEDPQWRVWNLIMYLPSKQSQIIMTLIVPDDTVQVDYLVTKKLSIACKLDLQKHLSSINIFFKQHTSKSTLN